AGLDFKHESIVWFGVSPRSLPKETERRQIAGLVALYWWERDQPGSPLNLDEKGAPWGSVEKLRFAPVVIEVRAKEVRGSVDGIALKPVGEEWVTDELARKARERPQFPPYVFVAPAFGTGIG